MPKLIDLSGNKYGEWSVLGRDFSKDKIYWLCNCSCGTTRSITSGNLRRKLTTNCGCIQREKIRIRMSTHGQSKSKLYGVWLAMRRRCYLPTVKDYYNWGGRGIEVCDEWKESYENFNKWAIDNGYKEGLTIERLDNDKNYSPENCKWATRKEQNRNRRNTALITIGGITRSLGEWSEISGINHGTLDSRIRYGWKDNELLIPTKGRGANGTNARKSEQPLLKNCSSDVGSWAAI